MDELTPEQQVKEQVSAHASRMANEFLELHRVSNIVRMASSLDSQSHHLKDIENRLQKIDQYVADCWREIRQLA